MNTTPEAHEGSPTHRRIRSFVTRAGRISVAQQRALDTLMPSLGIAYGSQLLDYAATFGRNAATVVEIGFGMGETTAIIARDTPSVDFIGIEVHTPGVGALLKTVGELELANLRVIQHDAVEVMQHMIAPASLAGVHVFFPDPWHKARHHKRRLLQAEFVALLASRLAPGGYLHCATDWQDYAEQMLAVLSADASLQNTASDYASRTNPLTHRPPTKFEQRGLRLGHGVWDVVFTRT